MKFLLLLIVVVAWPNVALASSIFNHPILNERPVSFTEIAAGDFMGLTETGTSFTQYMVANDYGIKLQKFTIVDISFYVSARGVIEAESDTAALSIYFARV